MSSSSCVSSKRRQLLGRAVRSASSPLFFPPPLGGGHGLRRAARGESLFNGEKGGLGPRPVRAACLGEVGPSAAALPAESLRPDLGQCDGIQRRGKVGCHPRPTSEARPSWTAASTGNARAEAGLEAVHHSAELAGGHPFNFPGQEADGARPPRPANGGARPRRPPPAPSAPSAEPPRGERTAGLAQLCAQLAQLRLQGAHTLRSFCGRGLQDLGNLLQHRLARGQALQDRRPPPRRRSAAPPAARPSSPTI